MTGSFPMLQSAGPCVELKTRLLSGRCENPHPREKPECPLLLFVFCDCTLQCFWNGIGPKTGKEHYCTTHSSTYRSGIVCQSILLIVRGL